jgi:3-oxoacyl-[acyl-carrier protein] reductase
MSEHELTGRVAIVTGAGRNIGRAIARELAAGGAAVVVNVRSNQQEADAVVREIEAAGGQALAGIADVGNTDAVQNIVAAGMKRFGRIDFLVNNAAIRREKPLDQMSLADFREVTGVILDGAFNCVKACLAELKRSGAGAIVNIGGMSAHTGSKHRVHVTAAKAGLVGLTRGLAHDLAADNVTANCVIPGLIATPRDPNLPEPQHHSIHHTLSGKRGASEDIATAVRFLCGPGARFITGQVLHVNGGAYLGS